MTKLTRRQLCRHALLPLAAAPPALLVAASVAAPMPDQAAVPERADPPKPIARLRPGEWLELPNTKIRDVTPTPAQRGDIRSITRAWNGGAIDTARSRLLIWGGGHADYFGNELYALDLPSMRMLRLTDPSPYTGQADCKAALPDGTPTARHTYGGLTYIEHLDHFLAVSGSLAPCGSATRDVWAYDLTAKRWIALSLEGPISGYGALAVYDQQTRLTYIKGRGDFFAFSHESRQAVRLNKRSQPTDYHLTAAIDPKRRKFVMVGDGVQAIDLTDHSMVKLDTTNAPAIVFSKQSPGIGYDPATDSMLVWHGGDKVHALNLDTLSWTQIARNRGPASKAPYQGTFGRWGYVPQFKVFVLVNDVNENAWVFKASA